MNEEDMIPLPRPTALSRPHWDGCRDGRLMVQRCTDCYSYVFIPQPRCTRCHGDTLSWVQSSGRGRVYAYTLVHRAPRPQFDAPYAVVIVELEEGWHMLSNLLDCPLESIAVDMPVRVDFRRMTDDITLPCFVPA